MSTFVINRNNIFLESHLNNQLMKIPFDYGRLSHLIFFNELPIHKRQTSMMDYDGVCKTVKMYDSGRNEIIRKLLREKTALLKASFWPWKRNLVERHKAINLQLEALGVFQGKIT